MSPVDLIGLVRGVLEEVGRLRALGEGLHADVARLKAENQGLKDEIARLKHLPPRPAQRPSGMDKATQGAESAPGVGPDGGKGGCSTRRRSSHLDKLTLTATVEITLDAPAGSRRRGFEEIVVQDLVLTASATLYRRARWETPEGAMLVAPLDPGIVGGYGPHLQRLILMPHFQGQMTCERILAVLNGAGVVISKRQVVRLLSVHLERLRAEDEAVLTAGLAASPFVTVDDTGARHQGESAFTTHIGSDGFAVFRTGPSKSRLAFLRNLLGGTASYAVNDAALAAMAEGALAQDLLDQLAAHPTRRFSSHEGWMRHLNELGLTGLKTTPDPVRVASEGALLGAIHEQGRLGGTVIVSDGAGQFRVGLHAQCWVHAERLVHKLLPANDKQRNAVAVAKRMIWWFYRALKDYKRAPGREKAEALGATFERIFRRARAGYASLDALLRRIHRLKGRLLRVLERPEIPLHTNGSENDIRAFVTKRKISGGTVSEKGRQNRDVMLGLAKTCAKLKIRFFDFLGDRLAIKGPEIPRLDKLVRSAKA